MSSKGSEASHGVDTAQVARPRDLREARDVMVDAARAGHRVLLRGSGTAQTWGAPVREVDLVVDTTGLDQIIAYNPADMTVAVGAGIRLQDLQSKLDRQRVSLDAARVAEGATVGGLLATADGGPIRATYGTLRDLVIGVIVILADGTVARSGGHVIKNVAGYDLAKLFSGSLGAFGLVAEVVLRVHPLPETSGTLAIPCDAPTAFRLASELLASPLEPVAIEWHAGRLLARFEGTQLGVANRLGKAQDLVQASPGFASASVERLTENDESAAWDAVAADVRGTEGDTVLRAGTRPREFPALVTRLDELSRQHDVDVRVVSSLGIGVHTVRIHGGQADQHAAVVDTWRSGVVQGGGSVTMHRRIAGLDDLIPSWGPAPQALSVLRSLKDGFDPDGRLAPGRFAPWW
ncbi:MAG TPA: FAD-binding oxidoreductase [Actinopolymorphaceae bacterium]